MHIQELSWSERVGWQAQAGSTAADRAGLVLYFGDRATLSGTACVDELRARFGDATLLGCSTGGQITGAGISEVGAEAVAVSFRATPHRLVHRSIAPGESGGSEVCAAVGRMIGDALRADDLAGVFVLCDGMRVSGSALAAGLAQSVGPQVLITGGLAGDGDRFGTTLVGADAAPAEGCVAGLGFYGGAVRFAAGSCGGWDAFGPRRQITAAVGTKLLALDGRPALDLYERYLGEEAAGLPGTGLLFPLKIWDPLRPEGSVVRTVLGIDRDAGALHFAGDMPVGWRAQLMRGTIDGLCEGAHRAAAEAMAGLKADSKGAKLALMVSCIGRRLLMGQRTMDEVEAASEALPGATRIGFFSYGEIAPKAGAGPCMLHNQTMTITLLAEQGA